MEMSGPVFCPFIILIRIFFKIFAEFTLFCFLFVAKRSFGSFQWRMSRNPSQPAICSRSCNVTEKTQLATSLCGKHSEGNDVAIVWREGLLSGK